MQCNFSTTYTDKYIGIKWEEIKKKRAVDIMCVCDLKNGIEAHSTSGQGMCAQIAVVEQVIALK